MKLNEDYMNCAEQFDGQHVLVGQIKFVGHKTVHQLRYLKSFPIHFDMRDS